MDLTNKFVQDTVVYGISKAAACNQKGFPTKMMQQFSKKVDNKTVLQPLTYRYLLVAVHFPSQCSLLALLPSGFNCSYHPIAALNLNFSTQFLLF